MSSQSFGPYGEQLGTGQLVTHAVATEDMQLSGDGSQYVAAEAAPQDRKSDVGVTSAEPAPIDGLPQGQEVRSHYSSILKSLRTTNAHADHVQANSSPAGELDLGGIGGLAGPRPAVLAPSSEKGVQPRGVSLGLPTTPAYQMLSNPYSDQYGWTPFDDYEFVYAARLALTKWEDDFREILATKGGFRQFWDTCDLPKWNAPSEDTNALTLWEVDHLLRSIHEYPLMPEPVPSLMFGDFEDRIKRTSLARSLGVKELPPHLLDQMTEMSDDSLIEEDESSFSSMERFKDIPEDDADDVANTGSVPVMTEEERMTKVARLLQNFRPRKGKKLENVDIKTIEQVVEAMSLKSERPCSDLKLEELNGMPFAVANGESKDGFGPAQAGSLKAFTSTWCRHCGRSYELVRGGRLKEPRKRNGDGSSGSDETVVSECCNFLSESSDEDEKYCQGIV